MDSGDRWQIFPTESFHIPILLMDCLDVAEQLCATWGTSVLMLIAANNAVGSNPLALVLCAKSLDN